MEIWSTEEKELRRIAIEKANPDNPELRGRLSDEEYQRLKANYDELIRGFENPLMVYETRAKEAAQNLLTGLTYKSYLESNEWKQKRAECLSYYGYRCGVCYSKDNPEVHHRTYERIFNEDPTDLVVLCHECHSSFHKKAPEYY